MKFSLKVFVPKQTPIKEEQSVQKQDTVSRQRKIAFLLQKLTIFLPVIGIILIVIIVIIGLVGSRSDIELEDKGQEQEVSQTATTEMEVKDHNIDLGQYNVNIVLKDEGDYEIAGKFDHRIIVRAEQDKTLKLKFRDVKLENKENVIMNESRARVELEGDLIVQSEKTAVDSYIGFVLTEGKFLFLGKEMLAFPDIYSQKYLSYVLNENVPVKSNITIEDAQNNEIVRFNNDKEFRTVIFSKPDLKAGEYRLLSDEKVLGNFELK